MLTNKQKENLRHLNIFQSAERERNGKMINGYGREFSVPSYDEILEMALQKITKAGFCRPKRVSPSKANCLIRLSRVTHFPYDGNFTINYFEVNFYTRKKNTWIMEDALGNECEISYSKHTCRFWLEEDMDPIFIDPDSFFDVYVKV